MSSDEGWDDDDDMADLFAFGNDGAPAVTSPEQPPAVEQETRPPERKASSDSILDMLDGETGASVLGELSSAPAKPMEDKDAQEILNWLDEEETPATSSDDQVPVTEEGSKDDAKEEEVIDETKELPTTELTGEKTLEPEKSNVQYQPPQPTIAAIPPLPKPEVVHFDSLEDALASSQSTVDHLRTLFVDGGMKVEPKKRALLWCRAVSGKTVEQVEASSLADSFLEWQETANIEEEDDVRSVYIRKEVAVLAERIVAGNETMTLDDAKRALCEVLFFYYQSSSVSSQEVDPLLPPVACTLLSAGFPTAAASVMLTYIMAIIPLLALTQEERWEAAKSLHSQFYLLACYHLPLLVFHLDRYAPGWYWPKKLGEDESGVSESESVTQKGRNLESHGVVPQSWLVSHLAGECGGTLMNPMWLLSLWDLILTSSNNSLRFFLSLAVLDKHSEELLMLTGSDLLEELQRIMEFKEGTTPEGFAIVAEEETSESEADDWVQEWCDRARALWEETPRSVVSQLRTAEDEAVKKALFQRQKCMEEEIQARLEAEAKAYREAAEAEKERKSEEARLRLSRARLVAYYRTHNPEKEGNIDKMMDVYKGRLEVLDMKLKAKYGVGFNPALKAKSIPKISANKRVSLSTMNPSGLSSRHTQAQTTKNDDSQPGDTNHQVAVKVSVTEVLPVICWSKEAASSSGATALARGRYSHDHLVPLKFYLVDSRPEAPAQEQGRFPTAVAMSPEALLDPDRIQQNEEMFESLRGTVHICIMGEGYSRMHELYGQKVAPKLQQAIDEDDARTSLCALFFVKKGFPFVSILDGGFVQAHSWLCREGPKRHLDVSSVLIDYDETNSFFGRLEKQHSLANKSTREKTQYALQSLLDSSMTSLAMKAKRMENMASGLEFLPKPEGDEEASFVGGSTELLLETDENEEEEEVEEGSFVNSFASIRNAAANLRKGQSATNDPDKKSESSEAGGEKDAPTNADGAESKFKNPFAGLRTAADNLRKSEAVPGTAVGEDGGAEVETQTTMFRNPFAARRSVVPEKGQEEEKQEDAKEVEELDLVDVDVSIAPEAPTKPSTFARFGSAADNLRKAASSSIQKGTEQKASQSAPKRNPFAKWGQTQKPAEIEGNKPNRFGGINMNQLKVNLPNLRGKAASDEDKADREVEESISFDHNDDVPAAGPSDSAGDEKKTKETAVQAVVTSV